VGTPKQLYKFLHRRDLHWLLEAETLRVGSAEYYRKEYARREVKDQTINDPNEGTLIRPQVGVLGPWSTEREKSFFGLQGRQVSINSVISQNTFIVRVPDFHMICFAHAPIEPVVKALCDPTVRELGIEPYDACVAIDDVPGLLGAIIQTGRLLGEDGRELGHLGKRWGRLESGYVSYGDLSVPLHETPPVQDGFLKDTSFRHQQEYRLKLHLNPGQSREYDGQAFTIRVPGLKRFLSPVELEIRDTHGFLERRKVGTYKTSTASPP
jgi:hypothetical protein